MFTTGAVFDVVAALTTIVISEVEDNASSVAVSRKVYLPAVENVAVVFSALALAKVTTPGPPIALQVVFRVLFGMPALAVPERLAAAGNVMV